MNDEAAVTVETRHVWGDLGKQPDHVIGGTTAHTHIGKTLVPSYVELSAIAYSRRPWWTWRATLHGLLRRKDGSEGDAHAQQLWTGADRDRMPQWVGDLIAPRLAELATLRLQDFTPRDPS